MSDDTFAPQIETIPEQVRQGVAQALGVSMPSFRRLHGGTTLSVFRFLRLQSAKNETQNEDEVPLIEHEDI
jgi:hypothetical protein